MRETAVPAARIDPTLDREHMREALSLAERGLGLCAPNPMVGALVVDPEGAVVGRGWHEGPGTDHAEVVALREAGDRARGAILYVTLEPCSHLGRTPPCAPAVRDAGIARVVAATGDPNPVVDGSGFAILRDAGIEVEVGVGEHEATRLIEGFARQVVTGLPFVTVKLAATLDGRVAAPDGTSRWITGPVAREDVHRLRARAGAVVVGAGTAVLDRPSLTVRLAGYRGRQPLRVVVDGSGRTPAEGPLFDGTLPTLVATSSSAPAEAVEGWSSAGAEVLVMDGGDRKVSLPALIEALGARRIQDVVIEGGPTLAWSAMVEGVADRLVVYLAPALLGAGPGMFEGGVATLADALPVRMTSVERLGDDLRVEADVHRDR